MKKRILLALIAVVVASVMLVTSVSAASVDTFADKNEWPSWATDSISYVIENDLMSGTGAGRFDFAGQVTRAQMAQMLYNLDKAVYGEPTIDSESKFEDITSDVSWAKTAIDWAADKGIVTGTNAEGTAFNPKGLITNGAMAKMLYGYAQYRGFANLLDITRVDDTLVPVEMFYEDMMGEWSSSDWWYESVTACGAAALLIGSTNDEDPDYPIFNLNNTSMRAQAAIVLTRLHKFLSIETLEAEVIMDKWQKTYNNCAHPGNVYFFYSRNGAPDNGSPELNRRIIREETIQAAFNAMFDMDLTKWRIEIPQLSEIPLAFQGKSEYWSTIKSSIESGGQISGVNFSLVNIENPEIRIDSSLNMAMCTSNSDYYHWAMTYDSNPLGFCPSAWACHDRRDNYHAESGAYLTDVMGQWLEYAKQSDGKIHVAVDPDFFDVFDVMEVDPDDNSVWYKTQLFPQQVLRALYHSWQASKITDDAIIATPVVVGWEQIEYDFDNPTNPFYNADWGDVPTKYPKYEDGSPAMYYDGNLVPQDKLSIDGVGQVVYVDESGDTHSVDPIVTARGHGPKSVEAINALKTSGKYEVTLPMYFKIATDFGREGSGASEQQNVTFVFEANNQVSTFPATYAQVVREAETPTLEALGDFYCAECGALHIAVGTAFGDNSWWKDETDPSKHYIEGQKNFLKNPGTDSIDNQDFLLYWLRLHAGQHMDSSKYTIVGASFDSAKWSELGGHASATSFELTLKVGKAADASFTPVELKVLCSAEVNQHIANPTEGEGGIVTGFTTAWPDYKGNTKGRVGDMFGCPHTDPKKDPNTFLNNILDTYYCELHECIHVNVHEAAQLVNNANCTNTIKGLLMDYNNGEGWKSRYNEGVINIKANTPLVTVKDQTAEGAVTVTLDGFYSTEVAYITVPVRYNVDTSVPTIGMVPAKATLTNVMTGEKKAFCTSTEEYKTFLAECDKADEAKLDEVLAKFQTEEYVKVYYNSNNVHGSWDPMFMGTTVMSLIDLDESFLIKHQENNWYTDADDTVFKAAFIEQGWWRIEEGIVVAENAKIPFKFQLRSTGRFVEKTIGFTMIAYNQIDGVTLTPNAPLAFEGSYEEKMTNDLTRFGDPLKAAINGVAANGITVYYNCDAPADESWTFGEVVGNAIAAKAGLVCDPANRSDYRNWDKNDYHVVRLQKFGDSWTYDPSVMPNGWNVDNGVKACENANVNFEFLLPGVKMNASIIVPINVTLVRDTSLANNTAVVK